MHSGMFPVYRQAVIPGAYPAVVLMAWNQVPGVMTSSLLQEVSQIISVPQVAEAASDIGLFSSQDFVSIHYFLSISLR